MLFCSQHLLKLFSSFANAILTKTSLVGSEEAGRPEKENDILEALLPDKELDQTVNVRSLPVKLRRGEKGEIFRECLRPPDENASPQADQLVSRLVSRIAPSLPPMANTPER